MKYKIAIILRWFVRGSKLMTVYTFKTNFYPCSMLIEILKTFPYTFLFLFNRLHNLFHGYHPKTPYLFDVYCTWIEAGTTCRNLNSIPTDLKQVRVCFYFCQNC